ncbi:hypothetical protein FJ656_28355 [Schumannella luteola]|uniref:Uncharacterized protein n=1 Tax=Schumannella luteola TaxID=472059 RepID=A0A852YHC8_9MICO|nr:hypothetical protein [Schumannella luteola]NYG98468.1 hypothetical protein [Schumannella luteola]TPX01306.1 hypothetical protein FJ656_28355 [Schumannella luteola]
MQSPPDVLVFVIVWTLLSAGITAVSIYGLRNVDKMARFFHAAGAAMYGSRIADRFYSRRSTLVGLACNAAIGPVFVVIGIVMIVRNLLGVS